MSTELTVLQEMAATLEGIMLRGVNAEIGKTIDQILVNYAKIQEHQKMPLNPMVRFAIRCGNEPYADDHICETCDDAIAVITTIRKDLPLLHQCRDCNVMMAERTRCSNIVASYGSNDQSVGCLLQEILDRIAFPEKR